eukprot:1195953-Prorocentrum_minimum.AAC.9
MGRAGIVRENATLEDLMVDRERQKAAVKGAVSGSVPVALQDLNVEQQAAAKYILEGHSCFVTGAAGTGKSYLLTYVIQELNAMHSVPGAVAVTAPTGVLDDKWLLRVLRVITVHVAVTLSCRRTSTMQHVCCNPVYRNRGVIERNKGVIGRNRGVIEPETMGCFCTTQKCKALSSLGKTYMFPNSFCGAVAIR